ncbi:MAG: SPASM domain-containing protein [Oscillospiraceae bacterium]|nr:SPASM domain-containing protein [Oscillospiraceae bacterium]
MNLTLHLTENCNMSCSYCPRTRTSLRMSEDVLDAACRLAFSSGGHGGLCFFGGEPLLEQSLITRAIAQCRTLSEQTGMPAQFAMTTNGTLLTADILQQLASVEADIGISFEGTAQNCCRHFADGSSSFSIVESKAKLLLEYCPSAYAMMTIAPPALPRYAEAVAYLYALGFRRITATIAYGSKVHWTDGHLLQLEEQLRRIAAFCSEKTLEGCRFYFSPLHSKIQNLLRGKNSADHCHLGFRQMPVAPDGRIYACTQFIGDDAYCLGDVFQGIDSQKQAALAMTASTPDTCKACALAKRCTNSCGCLNRLETGSEHLVSPLQCSYEKMLIAIADEMADRIFETAPELFRKRFM